MSKEPKRPAMHAVKSSNLVSIGHAGSNLFITFRSGGTYWYPEVPKKVYDEGVEAESPGRWFRDKVMGTYTAHKMVD